MKTKRPPKCIAYPSLDKQRVSIHWPESNKWENYGFWAGLLRACWLELNGTGCLWMEQKP